MTKILCNDAVWRGLAVFLLSIIIGIGGWGLLEVTSTPKIYITRAEAAEQKQELVNQLCNTKAEINSRIKEVKKDILDNQTELKKDMLSNQNKLEKKLNSMHNLIIEHMINSKNWKNGKNGKNRKK